MSSWVSLQDGLPNGTYTVSWRVVSVDSHPIREAFVFHVGEPGARPQGLVSELLAGTGGAGVPEAVALAAARWSGFAALLVLIGALPFRSRVWGRGGDDRPAEVEERFLRRWRALAVAAWTVLLVATLAAFLAQAAVAADLRLAEAMSGDIVAELAGTRFGRVMALRVVLLATAALLWSRRRAVGRALAACCVALAATPALAGHAGATQPLWLNVPADLVHVLAAAVWAGGLVVLLAAAFPATRALEAGERTRVLAPVVARLSDMALVAVAVLVATGLLRAWAEIRALRALPGTSYGLTLLVKLAAFVPLVVLGGINNRWTKPRLVAAAAAGTGSDEAPRTRRGPLSVLRRTVSVEVALVGVVLAVTAVLVTLPPARVTAGITAPFTTHVALGEHRLDVVIDPNRTGANALHLMAWTADHQPLDADYVEVRFTMPARDLGPLVAHGMRLAPGHWTLQGRELSVPGDWLIEVVVPVDRFTDERASFTVTVNP